MTPLPAVSAASCSHFPFEIYDHIFSILPEHSDTLHACTLVCKNLSQHAQRHLYTHLVCTSYSTTTYTPDSSLTSNPYNDICDFLILNPRLASYVRKLTVRGVKKPGWPFELEYTVLDMCLLARLLLSFPVLKEIDMDTVHWRRCGREHRHLWSVSSPRSLIPELRTLRLSDIDVNTIEEHPAFLPFHAPQLRELSFLHVLEWPINPDPYFGQLRNISSLQSLSLSVCMQLVPLVPEFICGESLVDLQVQHLRAVHTSHFLRIVDTASHTLQRLYIGLLVSDNTIAEYEQLSFAHCNALKQLKISVEGWDPCTQALHATHIILSILSTLPVTIEVVAIYTASNWDISSEAHDRCTVLSWEDIDLVLSRLPNLHQLIVGTFDKGSPRTHNAGIWQDQDTQTISSRLKRPVYFERYSPATFPIPFSR